MNRIAAVDLGSLTVRLAVAEVAGPGRLRVIKYCREITGLGRGLAEAGNLTPAAMARTLAALADFVREIREHGVERLQAVTTQAVRQAGNREEFIRRVEDLGLPVRLLAPEEEARLTLRGVLTALDRKYLEAGPLVIFDLGGGSSEFLLLRPEAAPWFAGLPLGVLALSQAQPVGDPPDAARVSALEGAVKARLKSFYAEHFAARLEAPPTLVGTAGAVTTLAAMALKMTDYDPRRVNNFILPKPEVEQLAAQILALPEAARARLPGLEPAKAGVMVAGVLMVKNILETFGQESLVVVDAGLLEGLLAELAA
jgi:exopolyphosphatase / guanosine-5'-triphosphate,3'-diphosphate pyrophosphatase